MTGTLNQSGQYQLNTREQGMDCKSLTGQAQLAILALRRGPASIGTGASRGIRNGYASVYADTPDMRSGDGQYAYDRARLIAYNDALATRGCATFDIDKELSDQNIDLLPRPVPTSSDA